MNRDPLDMDMGDDEQEDEIREYERYIENPPENLTIRDREGEDDGRLGIGEDLDERWTRRGQRTEDVDDSTLPAEEAAMEIIDDSDLER
ncbi:hypothetical protein [Nocardia amikacinitolerans]|uniref:hypothetical protein n=1 Tax=Nocardia amikacinitolerans TaxID=756689 RepID=UPI0020A29354|nr:hypothetical protein [Nocardia amikacinitolerans]MCP2291039.1 hypothetical protein [Nocardia amikacinitolerans]